MNSISNELRSEPARAGKPIDGPEYPLASVIIPTYNHAQYLAAAIRSVLQQTYRSYEVIVVDDGSTDETSEIVANFGETVRYIRQENQGLSAARNAGIHAAKGSMIGLLDADDLYEPAFLETLVSILLSDGSVDGVYCSAQAVDTQNDPLPQRIGGVVPPEQFHSSLLKGGFFPPICMFAYKYCYEEAGLFDTSFEGCADWDMWLRMSSRFYIVGTDRVLTRYRIVPSSMSHNVKHMADDRRRVLQKHFADEPEKRSQWSTAYRMALGYSHVRAAIESLQVGNLGKTSCYLREAFIAFPQLARDFDVFYKLALGDQPMGFRGDFSTIDLKRNAQFLIALLDSFMDDPEVAAESGAYRNTIYANAYLALGLLHYGARQFGEARRFLLRAMAIEPGVALKKNGLSTLAKSLIGPRAVEWFKTLRPKSSTQE